MIYKTFIYSISQILVRFISIIRYIAFKNLIYMILSISIIFYIILEYYLYVTISYFQNFKS